MQGVTDPWFNHADVKAFCFEFCDCSAQKNLWALQRMKLLKAGTNDSLDLKKHDDNLKSILA